MNTLYLLEYWSDGATWQWLPAEREAPSAHRPS
jgi:hypothetical protein